MSMFDSERIGLIVTASCLFSFCLTVGDNAYGAINSWNAGSGVLPSDPSIPADQRFELVGEQSFVSLQNGYVNINDDSQTPRMGFEKTGIDTIPADDEWAFQTEIRINSHSRPYLDWAADLAIMDGNKSVMLLIAKDAVGFANPNAHSYVNGSFYALDTTDTFHTYRVIKNMASVDLFVDNMVSPVVSVPYNDFQLWWDNTNMILLASTSTMGVAN